MTAQVVALVLSAGFSLRDCGRITPGMLFDVLEIRHPKRKEEEE